MKKEIGRDHCSPLFRTSAVSIYKNLKPSIRVPTELENSSPIPVQRPLTTFLIKRATINDLKIQRSFKHGTLTIQKGTIW